MYCEWNSFLLCFTTAKWQVGVCLWLYVPRGCLCRKKMLPSCRFY